MLFSLGDRDDVCRFDSTHHWGSSPTYGHDGENDAFKHLLTCVSCAQQGMGEWDDSSQFLWVLKLPHSLSTSKTLEVPYVQLCFFNVHMSVMTCSQQSYFWQDWFKHRPDYSTLWSFNLAMNKPFFIGKVINHHLFSWALYIIANCNKYNQKVSQVLVTLTSSFARYSHCILGGFSIRLLTPCLGQKMSGIAS